MGLFKSAFNVLSGFADNAVSIFNNERSIDYAKQNLAYQKQLQQQIFNREDTAVQRRAADLKAAGFNPLLAAGGAASSGAAVQTTAPSSDAKTNFAANALMLHRMKIDNSMTKAQQELLTQQTNNARLNGILTQKTIDWYDKHPSYAPGVEAGIHTGKGLSSVFDDVSNRLSRRSTWLGDGKSRGSRLLNKIF